MSPWRKRQNLIASSTSLFMVCQGAVKVSSGHGHHFYQHRPRGQNLDASSQPYLPRNSFTDLYRRVPKELIARYVKICPTCQSRRPNTTAIITPPPSNRSSPTVSSHTAPSTPAMLSPPESRRDSMVKYPPSEPDSAVSSPGSYGVHGLQNHHFWAPAGHLSPPQFGLSPSQGSVSTAYGSIGNGFGNETSYAPSSAVPATAAVYGPYRASYGNDGLMKREYSSNELVKGDYPYSTMVKRERL